MTDQYCAIKIKVDLKRDGELSSVAMMLKSTYTYSIKYTQ